MDMLNPLSMPLHSRHLIEASAGTGKTFNITRIYVRLLLEKKLSVQQILVMTYTKAATEEIKARVAAFIREVEAQWDAEIQSEFTKDIQKRVDREEGRALLISALLSLDEASIFTIHGFCQRVLKQFAVALNTEMEPELLTDTSTISLQATQDWIRSLASEDDSLQALAKYQWHQPDLFFAEFRTAIESDEALTLMTQEQCYADIVLAIKHFLNDANLREILDDLVRDKVTIFDAVINSHKMADERAQEWQVTLHWLENVLKKSQEQDENTGNNMADSYQKLQVLLDLPKALTGFVDGKRYTKKQEAKQATEALRNFRKELLSHLKKWQSSLDKKREQIQVLSLVEAGIYQIREKITQRKSQLKVMSFDDLIRQFAGVIDNNQNLIRSVRAQFPVALVDEFQDTDAQQYHIFDTLYPAADPASLLVMIGDPKQAIYGFRGGDIFVYLKAKQQADYTWFMDTNWRSSANMVAAYNRVFWGQSLSEKTPRSVFGFDIHYENILSTSQAKAAQHPFSDPLEQHRERAAITYMLASDGFDSAAQDSKVDALEQHLVSSMSQEIARLLVDGHIGEEGVKPSDIAILVRDGIQAETVQASLIEKGMASVYLSQKSPLFESEEAVEIFRVLRAIANFDDRRMLIGGLTSSLLLNGVKQQLQSYNENAAQIGSDEKQFTEQNQTLLTLLLADTEHEYWDTTFQVCLELQQLWQREGVFALLMLLIKSNFHPIERAERSITNMMHIAESLAAVASLNRSSDQQLSWLSHQISNASREEALQLRLESDANLIKVVTLHGSKGLEYPIVFVPFANRYKDPSMKKKQDLIHFRYQDLVNGKAVYQLGSFSEALQQYKVQEHAESMRLLYVAITRAEYRCYLGIVDKDRNADAALHSALNIPRNVLNATGESSVVGNSLHEWLHKQVVSSSDGTHAIMQANTVTPELASGQLGPNAGQDLDLQRGTHANENSGISVTLSSLDLSERKPWLISSFSNLSRFQDSDSHSTYDIASPNELSLHALEAATEHDYSQQVSSSDSNNVSVSDSFCFSLKKGADTGNLLHDILEHVDFVEPNWEEVAAAPLAKFDALSEADMQSLFAWLQRCLDTPIVNSRSLSSFSSEQTLREPEFYFPMQNVNLLELSSLLNRYRQSRCTLFGIEFQAVTMQDIPAITGMMHGFIDLIFECDGQYYVADYKSTYLGDQYTDYLPVHCHQNNQHHLYDLQYLIYGLALHKYLSGSLVDYDFDTHFGGVRYLYLRGMRQLKDKTVTGVFSDNIELQWLQALDAVFSGKEKPHV